MRLQKLSEEDQNNIVHFLNMLAEENILESKSFGIKIKLESMKNQIKKWKEKNPKLIDFINETDSDELKKIENESI